MPCRVVLFSGLSSVSSVPDGSAANASFVGANTVYGPGPDSVSTSPAALTAATNVEKSELDEATWTMFWVGADAGAADIAAEPLGLLVLPHAATVRALKATAITARFLANFISVLLCV